MPETSSAIETGNLWAKILAAGARVWHFVHDGAAEIVKITAEHPEILKEAEALLPKAADEGIDAAVEIANVVNGIGSQAEQSHAQ